MVVIIEIVLALRDEQEFAKWIRAGRTVWTRKLWGGNLNKYIIIKKKGLPRGSAIKNSPANAGDAGLIPGSG